MGGFDAKLEDPSIKTFSNSFNRMSLIDKPTCFKNLESPPCLNLIQTECPRSFQNFCVIQTRLSDFHRLFVTVMILPSVRLNQIS